MSALAGFLDRRRSLRESGWREGADRELAEALARSVAEFVPDPPPGTAVVATGGFGRGSLALWSDVDLMILHRGEPPEDLARALLHPLWDAGLKVGHSVRTPAEARAFAGTRLDAVCLFLTARTLSGDPELLTELHRLLAELVEREYGLILDRLAAEERRRRQEQPFRLQAADLKTGRGGQRTLDLLDWRRRLQAMAGLEPTPVAVGEEEAATTLVAVRSALHAAADRAVETFDLELRDPAAEWLGVDVVELGRRVLRAQRLAEAAAETGWPELRRAGPEALPAAREPGLKAVVRAVRRRIERPDLPEVPEAAPRWTASDREAFLALTRPELTPALWSLVHSGWIDANLPELAALVDVPHLAAFHRHPAFDHSVATVAEVDRLLAGEDPALAEVAARLSEVEALRWAALLHDVGKAVDPARHAEVGAPLAAEAARRVGLDAENVETVRRLVALHLQLVVLATRDDPDRPAALVDVVDRVGDPVTLDALALLTAADSRAADPDLWRPWRAELVMDVHARLRRRLTGAADREDIGSVVEAVVAADPGRSSDQVSRHLVGLGEAYRRAHPPEIIALHVALASSPPGPGGARVGTAPAAGATRVALVVPDRPGLLALLCGAFALERLSILDARVATRTDGLAFDTFLVVEALSGEAPGDLATLEGTLARALQGGFDLEGAVAEKQRSYRPTEQPGIRPRVSVRRFREGGGVVEVETADRLGLAFDLAHTLHRLGVPIQRARLDTRAGVAHDVLWVWRLPVDTTPVEEALRAVV